MTERARMIAATLPQPRELARKARLCYTTDDAPGIHRIRKSRRFIYLDKGGQPVSDVRVLQRIEQLVIPPAWTDVWICPSDGGHIQATGRDARGRKQYLYHTRWQLHTSRLKFNKLHHFCQALPRLRRRVARDLALPKLSRQKVVATIISLLDRTLIRVGNEEYARANGSFGLTTLRDNHARVNGVSLRLRFQGKSGKLRDVEFQDRRIARIVRQCQELPGQQLFQFQDERGIFRRVESADVNHYLRATLGGDFSAKDFRTWKASALVLARLYEEERQRSGPLTATAARQTISRVLREVADALGNTVTVCRKYYVHPRIVDLFSEDKLIAACGPVPRHSRRGLAFFEEVLLRFLPRLERPGHGVR